MLLSQVSPPLVLVEVQSMLGILIELLVLLFAPPPKFPPWDLNKHYTFVLMLHLSRFLKSSNRTGKRGMITKLHPKKTRDLSRQHQQRISLNHQNNESSTSNEVPS